MRCVPPVGDGGGLSEVGGGLVVVAEEADGVQGSGAPHAVGGLGVGPFGVGEPALDAGSRAGGARRR